MGFFAQGWPAILRDRCYPRLEGFTLAAAGGAFCETSEPKKSTIILYKN